MKTRRGGARKASAGVILNTKNNSSTLGHSSSTEIRFSWMHLANSFVHQPAKFALWRETSQKAVKFNTKTNFTGMRKNPNPRAQFISTGVIIGIPIAGRRKKSSTDDWSPWGFQTNEHTMTCSSYP